MTKHGRITNVYYEQGAVFCDVEGFQINGQETKVPVLSGFAGLIQVPEVGQRVLMERLGGDTLFITDLIEKSDDAPASLSPGDIAIQLDGETVIKATKNISGTYDIDVSASGDVNIEGVPFDQHVHEHGDTTIEDTGDGSGTSSTVTETTDGPKAP